MTTKTRTTTDLVQAHASPPLGMMFYDSVASVQKDVNLLGYMSVIERAWQELQLDGVLCLDNRPILYLKEFEGPVASPERIRLQKLFWNQGVANILVLADPLTVYLYSGLTTPRDDQTSAETVETSLIEKLNYADYIQQLREMYLGIATGHYYEINRPKFDPDETIDVWLLDNLHSFRNALITGDGKLAIKDAHAFIGRVLFLCYLLDRGIVSINQTSSDGTATTQFARYLESQSNKSRIGSLYGLFKDLKDRFNGNMFDQDLEKERLWIKPIHIEKLISFLGGHEVESGQRHLGFWPYNFKMIPVETISAIYEDFLAKEDPTEKRARGAFYTPRFLAEMVVDVAVQKDPDLLNGSFLDPACGSGIFLVILFNRMANRWIQTQTGKDAYLTRANALQEILVHRIRGIDIKETACRIACFSLYLAYLDFFNPPDIKKHVEKTGRPLPKLLDYGDTLGRQKPDIPVILKADSLSDNPLSGKKFNCVIGNPPWKGRGSKQIAQKFMEKAPDFLVSNGVGCLLLPTKILQNKTDTFQAEWLRKMTLESVLQLADYRFLLFKNALCPAFIARFKHTPPEPTEHRIEFNAPKFNRDGLRKGVVAVNSASRTWIPLADVLSATRTKSAPVVWKRNLWGTPRDQKLINLLQSLPSLLEIAGAPKENKRWIKGQGFQPNTSGKSLNPKTPWWRKTDLFIGAKAYCWESKCITIHSEDCDEIDDRFPSLHRPRDERIYKSPLVLVSQGFGKVAFCDFNVLFQDSLQSIAGPPEDRDLLMFLTVYLRSKLARYFLFHTSANWGTEREKVQLYELLRVPFLLPDNEYVSLDAKKIVKQVALKFEETKKQLEQKLKNFKSNRYSILSDDDPHLHKQWREERKKNTEKLQEKLDPLVYRYFGLTDQEITLVEDTIDVFEPSSTPSTWRAKTVTLDPIETTKIAPYSTQRLAAYANTLTQTLNSWAETEGSNHRVCAEGGTDGKTGLSMITVHLSNIESTFRKKVISDELSDSLEKYHHHISQEGGTLVYERDIFFFHGDRIHIIRPNILLNWTRTAALNDASRIYGEIALAQENA